MESIDHPNRIIHTHYPIASISCSYMWACKYIKPISDARGGGGGGRGKGRRGGHQELKYITISNRRALFKAQYSIQSSGHKWTNKLSIDTSRLCHYALWSLPLAMINILTYPHEIAAGIIPETNMATESVLSSGKCDL